MSTFKLTRNIRNFGLLNCPKYNHRSTTFTKLTYSTSPKPRNSALKFGVIGATVGLVVGGAYSGYNYYSDQKIGLALPNEETTSPLLNRMPEYQATRQVKMLQDKTKLKLVLFQYQTCPFCCKVRAFLDYYGFSYDVVEVDAVLRQSIRWSKYKKVPILIAKGENGYYQLNDSSMIISLLASFLADSKQNISELVNFYPSVKFTDETGSKKSDINNKYFLMFQGNKSHKRSADDLTNERKWRMWADEKLVHMLSPNVYRTHSEAVETFKWFSKSGEWDLHFPAWEVTLMVQVGALAMWLIGKKLKTKYNLKDDVRESLYECCDEWVRALEKQKSQFMGGKQPNLSDLAVYGILNSFEGCEAFKDVLENTNIGPWYDATKSAVRSNAGNKLLLKAVAS